MANSNIINAVFGSGLCAVTTSAFRANYGMVLRFSGIDLPTAFECDFSNYDVAGHDSITAIGQNNEVQIPDDMWDSGLNIYAYVYLHPTDDSGVTVYTVTIPVLGRPNRTEEEPTPHEQTVIEQAISALNDAVEQTAADVASADASAQAAALSEANASASERSAAASASAALASQNAAESAAQSATESASGAAESARNAANSASQAAESATAAQASAEQAERSVQSITDDVERAERAAATASTKATEAASSAATASTKAAQAEQSAIAAAQSAQSASTAAQNAAESDQLAESHATDAEQAKLDAQDAQEAAEAAQAAAEQAAESVSGLSAQIEQNTADIANLVLSKAGALVDTVSGSIASFVPDATVPTVRGLTVNVEPVQDLHGYDNPWPAGGGKNLVGLNTSPNRVISYTGVSASDHTDDAVTLTSNGNATYAQMGLYYDLPAGTYTLSIKATSSDSYTPVVSGYKMTGNVLLFNSCKEGQPKSFTLSETTAVNFRFFATTSDSTARTVTFYDVQLESGSTATAWTPYSNICPISGWDSVEVQRTGKNLLENELTTSTVNGTSFTVNADGSITVSGTPTAQTRVAIKRGLAWDGREVAVFSFGAMPTGTRVFARRIYNGTQNYPTISPSGTTTIGAEIYDIYLEIDTSFNGTAFTVYPQLELGSTATAYEPYAGNTYTIQLGQTVYGGTVDAVQGKMVVDRAMVDLGTLNWQYVATGGSNERFQSSIGGIAPVSKSEIAVDAICSNYPVFPWGRLDTSGYDKFFCRAAVAEVVAVRDTSYTDIATFLSAMSGVQLVYELATPITIDLTPLEISVLTGQTNNVWADSGDVTVEYAADLKTYINNKIAAAVAALS